MQEDLEIQTRGTPHTRFALRLRVGVAAAAVLVASFASAPFAAASVPKATSVHAGAAVTAVVPQWPHWGCPVQGTAPSARLAPVTTWPHWGCPLNTTVATKATVVIKGVPTSLWPHWGVPVRGARALWPHWGVPLRGAHALWPHWGGPVNEAQSLWPHWGGPVR